MQLVMWWEVLLIKLKKNVPTFVVTFVLLRVIFCAVVSCRFSGPVSGILACGYNLLLLVFPCMWG